MIDKNARPKRRRSDTPSPGGASTLTQWVNHCLDVANRPATLYSGARKIICQTTLNFSSIDPSLQLSDAGYTKSKLSLLTGHYLHKESQDVALQLWDKRKGQEKYGSVSFTTFAHFVKGGEVNAKRSKRASVFGPCIQSVVITLVSKDSFRVDVFYRTTELFKKFPADLVLLRDVLLKPFDFTGLNCEGYTFHFANLTAHPMYFITLIPHLVDPIATLESLKGDRRFYDWVVKWTARYVCPEHARGIQKFSQAIRVSMDANKRIDKSVLHRVQTYVRNNHPGFRNDYEDIDE